MPKICIAVLASISMFGTTALGPAMGGLIEFFPDHPTLVKMIFSLPALFVIPTTLLTPYICTIIPKKKLLLYSLIIYIIAGTIGGFLSNIYAILLSRAVLGIGIGFMMPISQSLPIDFYTGVERVRAVQMRNTSQNFGSFCCLLLSGLLATETWRGSFFIYLAGIPIFALILMALPQIPSAKTDEGAKSSSLFSLPPIIYLLSLYLFVFMTIVYAFYGNIAILIQLEGVGTSASAGYTLAFAALSATITSYNLARIRKVFGNYMEVLGWLLLGISFVIYATAQIMPLYFIGGMLSSASLGILFSNIMIRSSSAVEKSQGVQAMAFITVAIFLGQFVSPLVFDNIPLLPIIDGIRGIYLTLSFPSFFMAVIVMISVFMQKLMAK